jgi:hypothetical protein
VEDMNKIIDLSANIPEKLKPVLKKNATNDILTTEIQTNIRNNDNNEIIRDKLKSYKKYIDPQKYKTLHKQLNILEKQNERAVERLNIRQVKDFSNKLSGYTNCVTTNNCSPDTANLRENIQASGIDDEAKKVLIERFDDINDLSEILAEINNDLMGSYKSVESYITKNPDNDSNNLRRNNILRKYYNDKRMEFNKDPVQFVMSNNNEVKRLVEDLGNSEDESQSEDIRNEMRESISSALDGHSTRMLTNAEIDDISTTDDYKEQLAKIKQVISEKGKTVVDELIERKAVTKDIKAIGNISDIPVQHRVMELIRDEKEIKQLYANTPNSFDRTASILKGKSYYTDFIEASYIKTDAPDEVNSITKLTILQAMRDGDFSVENLERNFNTLMGDAQVVDKVIVPRDIPESLAKERLNNVKDSDFLYRVLKSKDIDFKGRIISIGAPDGIDVISRFSEEVESGDIEIAVEQGDVVFVKGGMFVRDDSGNLLRLPFDKFNPIEKSVDKELFMKNPHYMNYEVLDALRKL